MSSEIETADRSTSGIASGNVSGNTSGNISGNTSGNISGNTSGNDSSGNLLGNAAVSSHLRREANTRYRFTRIYRLPPLIHNHMFGRHQQSHRTCMCLHVRTGTMLLVLWHMFVHTMTLLSLTATLCAPLQSYRTAQQLDGAQNYDRDAFASPPLCKLFPWFSDPDLLVDLTANAGSSGVGAIEVEGETGGGGNDLVLTFANNSNTIVYESEDVPDRLDSNEVPPPLVLSSNSYPAYFGQLWFSNNIHSDLMITCVMLPITVLALVALLRNRPKLLHLFVIGLSLDLLCSFMAFGSVFVNLNSLRQSLQQLNTAGNNQAIQLLLQLDDLSLALVVFGVTFTVLLIKGYLLRMVIMCQQYLDMNQLTYSIHGPSAGGAAAAAGGGGGPYEGLVPLGTTVEPLVANSATGLPPDYETALKEFAKCNSAYYPHPPPSYEAAAAAAAPTTAAAAAAAPTAAAAAAAAPTTAAAAAPTTAAAAAAASSVTRN